MAGGAETLSGSNTYTGGTTLSAGVLNAGSTGALGSSGMISFGGGVLQYSAANQTDYSGRFSNAANQSYDIDTNGQTVTYASALTSSGGALTKLGAGTLVLAANETYSGPTTVNGGVLQLGAGGTTGSVAGAIGDNATLAFDRSDTDVYAGVITGAGVVNQIGSGIVSLTGSNSASAGQFTGTANVNAGVLAINGTFGDTAANSAVVNVNTGGTLHGSGTLDGSVVVNGGTVSAGNSPGTLTVAGNYTLTSGSTSLFELGAPGVVGGTNNDLIIVGGNLTLGGALSLVSATSATSPPVSGDYRLFNYGGTLSGSFASVSTPSANSTGTVYTNIPGQVNVLLQNGNQSVQYYDGADMTGATAGGQGGTGTWNATNTNWTGSPTSAVNDVWRSGVGIFGGTAGTVTVTGAQAVQGLQFIVDGYQLVGSGSLTLMGDPNSTVAQSFFNVNGGVGATIATTLTGAGIGLNKLGAGTLTLTGTDSYTGLTSINAGTLALTGTGSIAASSGVVDGGVFDISGTTSGASITTLSGAGSVTLGAETLTLTNASGTFAGAASGTGGLTVSGGTETLTGANTYTGVTAIGAGATLALSGTGSIASSSGVADAGTFSLAALSSGPSITSLSGAGSVTLGAETLTLTNASGTFSGVASGTGGLTLAGGTETLTGANTYTGATSINAGTTLALSAAGSIAASSGVADAGTFNIAGHANGTTIAGLSGTGSVILGANTLTLTNGGTFAGVASGTGGLTIAAGNETLTGNNTYTGTTTVSGGALTLGVGGTTGSVAGPIALASGVLTINHSNGVTLAGAISGGGSLVQAGAGTTVLTGADSYTGLTSITAGTLALSGAGSIAASSGVVDGGVFDISGTTSGASITTLSGAGSVTLGAETLTLTNASGTFAGAASGTGGLTVSGGTETLTGANTYTGVTAIGAGATLALSGTGSIASSSGVADAGTFSLAALSSGPSITSLSGAGSVTLGANTLTLTNAAGTFSGVASGTGGLTLAGGTETLTGANTYTGATAINGGTLTLGGTGSALPATSVVTVASGATLALASNQTLGSLSSTGAVNLGSSVLSINANGATTTISGPIVGTGGLTKIGGGELFLTGTDTFSGPTTVAAGILAINGALPNSVVSVLSGGALHGSGVAGNVAIGAGGIIAPGNSIGTLTVAGNLTLAPTAIYQDEVNAAGASDLIQVGGKATLGGTVQVLAAPGSYARQTIYTILTAAGGVTGTFNGGATSNFAFLTPTLIYGPNTVTLQLSSNNVPFQTLAATPNQVGVATALYASSPSSALFNAVLVQTTDGARQAFNALSGEIYATAKTVQLNDTHYVRDAVLDRLREAGDGGAHGPGYSAANLAPGDVQLTAWAQYVGAWSRGTSQAGGVAPSQGDTAGAILGLDGALRDWRVGVAVAQLESNLNVVDRDSHQSLETSHVAIYGGGPVWGALKARVGFDYAWNDIDAGRNVTFPGFSEQLGSHYHSRSEDAFGELGYGLRYGRLAIEPYANLTYVRLDSDGFSEGNEAAALQGRGEAQDAVFSDLGLRFSATFRLDTSVLQPYANLAWRHVYGGTGSSEALTFESTGTSFIVQGQSLDHDAGKIETGLALHTPVGATFTAGYIGQISQSWQDHQARVALSWAF